MFFNDKVEAFIVPRVTCCGKGSRSEESELIQTKKAVSFEDKTTVFALDSESDLENPAAGQSRSKGHKPKKL